MVSAVVVPTTQSRGLFNMGEKPAEKKESFWDNAWKWIWSGVKIAIKVAGLVALGFTIVKPIVALIKGTKSLGEVLSGAVTSVINTTKRAVSNFASGFQDFVESPLNWIVKKVSKLITSIKGLGASASAGAAEGAAAAAHAAEMSSTATEAAVAGVSITQVIEDEALANTLPNKAEEEFIHTITGGSK